jgi:hypothetical protein
MKRSRQFRTAAIMCAINAAWLVITAQLLWAAAYLCMTAVFILLDAYWRAGADDTPDAGSCTVTDTHHPGGTRGN